MTGKVEKPKIEEKKSGKGGFFDPEKRGINRGVFGGVIMMTIAVVWFVVGYGAGYIFYYPPILFVIGLFAFIKGLITGNIFGEKSLDEEKIVSEATEFKRINEYSDLFNIDSYGINFYIGLGLLFASIISLFTWRLFFSLVDGIPFRFFRLNTFLVIVIFLIIEVVIFLILSHNMESNWLMPFFFGLSIVLIHIVRYGVYNFIIFKNITTKPPLNLIAIFYSFVWGFLFLTGLIIAVRFWETRLRSFILACMLSSFSVSLIFQVYYMTKPNSSFSWISLASSIINGVIYGALIYAGLSLHLRKKGFLVHKGKLIPIKKAQY